jgi:L-threonylcarbamoyladenylate synthase
LSERAATRRTKLIAVDADAPEAAVIAEAAGVLRAGGLVAFPTETVYGLGANALDQAAVESIFAAKGRAMDDPLIVHIAERGELDRVARDVAELAMVLTGRFWPGPLTIVARRGDAVAPAVSGGLETVAVRLPAHPVALALIRAAGVPVAAPSANRFMRTSATTAAHVLEDLDGRIDIVLDGGPAAAGIESTVVAVDGATVRVLRRGAVTTEQLWEVLESRPGTELVVLPPGHRAGSPGAMERHYAPMKPLTLVDLHGAAGFAALEDSVAEAVAAGRRPGLLLTSEDADRARQRFPGLLMADLGSEHDPATIASRLFAAMRDLDRDLRTDSLVARTVPPEGLGAAVNDRLRRAATHVTDGQ